MSRVLICDDEPNLRATVARTLRSEGHDTLEARDGVEGVALLERGGIDAVLLDLDMPRLDGFGVLDHLAKEEHAPPVIVLTAHATLENAVSAIKRGAYDFVEKPPSAESLLLRLRRALENAAARSDARSAPPPSRMIGDSAPMRRLREQIDRVAATSARVLVVGENGTGKELVARAIHEGSERASRPLVRVNCAAIPNELFESELFGHVKGAFTGATTSRRGRFERASGGTLFLDEVGELPLALQPKLLRALEEGEIERVGAEEGTRVDVRVVAATNRDLPALVASGGFRQDLFFRLEVVTLEVPPLRARKDDIPALAEHLLRDAAHDSGRRPPSLTDDALALLAARPWPGNVRQLRNVLERAVILGESDRIDALELARHVSDGESAAPGSEEEPPNGAKLAEAVAEFEKRRIARVIEESDGNVSEAARRLGLERSSLYKKMKALGLRRG